MRYSLRAKRIDEPNMTIELSIRTTSVYDLSNMIDCKSVARMQINLVYSVRRVKGTLKISAFSVLVLKIRI